ncbi:MAG: sigma-54 dependent transcriptional regulator [Desulfohalobiaceae bacterium]|nr:sigma-54 dependent transcriptional regulator [Desulfohalobiaceae bacterium]
MSQSSARILICDDEESICGSLLRLMQKAGFVAEYVLSGEQALQEVALKQPDILLLDMKMPGMQGDQVQKKVKEIDPSLPVIFITAYADIQGAVAAIKNGASDYLAKPFQHHDVIRAVHRAVKERRLLQKLAVLSSQAEESCNLCKMMGPSRAVQQLVADVNTVAPSNFSVIIQGETGSGKELLARAIHHLSHRSGRPFVPVDCGAIPENLLESELFGHEKGAFTGAVSRKNGKFMAADKGTLFLDEIANMPFSSQAKLLRALQDRQINPLGSTAFTNIDVRLLAASNQDLEQAVAAGVFRDDLFYRLNEYTIRIPPLRERKQDIPYLAQRFVQTTNMELDKRVLDVEQPVMEALKRSDWPGNVRQLRSTIRRAVLLAGDTIRPEHLSLGRESRQTEQANDFCGNRPWEKGSFKDIVKESTTVLERDILCRTLAHTGGNKAKAARLLQIDYKTIYTKMKQFGLVKIEGEEYGTG